MPLPNGSYIVFGQRLPFDAAPQVHLLSAQSQEAFGTARAMAESSSNPEMYVRQVFAQFFSMPDADTAIPAWSRDALVLIAQGYEGPHQTEVRGLAAAIALDRPFSRDTRGNGSQDGGTPVTPNKPPKGPKGGDKVSAFDSLLTHPVGG